ncbi:hypothetical protein BHM03_00060148, partial [Ensete ventricosum]
DAFPRATGDPYVIGRGSAFAASNIALRGVASRGHLAYRWPACRHRACSQPGRERPTL